MAALELDRVSGLPQDYQVNPAKTEESVLAPRWLTHQTRTRMSEPSRLHPLTAQEPPDSFDEYATA